MTEIPDVHPQSPTIKIPAMIDSPVLASIIIAFLYIAVLSLQLSSHQYDPSYFIDVGERFVADAAQVPKNIRIVPGSDGYDGQFYYQLALNPFSPQPVNHGLWIDNGSYRHQRILYPLIVWLFSLGNPDLIPMMLLFVNFLALCTLAWLGARFAQVHDKHALWGCLFALYPGFLFTLTHNLTEILAGLFLLAGILSLRQSSARVQTAVLLTLGALTRETTLLIILALGISLAVERNYRAWPVIVTPLMVIAAWQIGLWVKWGTPPVFTAGLLLGMPVIGIRDFIMSLRWDLTIEQIWGFEIVYLAIIGIIAFISARYTRAHLPHKLAWLLSGFMMTAMTGHVWIADVAFMRAGAEFFLFSLVLTMISTQPWLSKFAGIVTAITWALVFFVRLNW
jgi:hypothetical protein